jgi:myo-inositol-hexaphosphate 3-phosphohydrolase
LLASASLLTLSFLPAVSPAQTIVIPRLTLADPTIRDQDDMCFWIHPESPELSTIITADKASDRLYVYDVHGRTLHSVRVSGQPGNVDIRYNFRLGSGLADLVAFNNRKDNLIHVYRVDPGTRQLARVDDGSLLTDGNYGACMYRSPTTGKIYVFSTGGDGRIEQWELIEADGRVSGVRVRDWDLGGRTEACVCDDETGMAYFGEENRGIWKVEAEPDAPTLGVLIAEVDDPSGLTDDVEGLAIYYSANGRGYLLVSSQGSNDFKIYGRAPPHDYVGTFMIAGVYETDGVDVTNVNLGPTFPAGAFAVHSHFDDAPRPVIVSGFEDLGLAIDTGYWNPRHGGAGPESPRPTTLSFLPIHDTRTRSDMPSDSYGKYATMRVRSENPTNHSFLKFEVSGLVSPVSRATLRLYCIDAGEDGGGVYVVSGDHPGTETPWDERTLTWENAPVIVGEPLAEAGEVALDTWVELDVTSAITGDGTYSFALANRSIQMAGYSTKEGDAPPQLVIETGEPVMTVIDTFEPTSGPPGTEVTILGSGFTGATAVAFNEVPASTFTVDGDERLRATVPSGAISGPIRVESPSGSATSANPFSVVTPVPQWTFVPSHDARTRSDKPTESYGVYGKLMVRSQAPTHQSYLKFDVEGLTGPVTRATLRLYCVDASEEGGAAYRVANHYRDSETPWDERAINWDNAPVIAGEALDREGAVAPDSWIELDVTAAIAGDGTYSFALASGTASTAAYSTKEGVASPQLVIEAAPAAVKPVAAWSAASVTAPLMLGRPQPNPFTERTRIRLELPRAAVVRATIHDIMGRTVRSLGDLSLTAGAHEITWDGRDGGGGRVRSGVYLLTLETPGYRATGKLIVSR